MASGSDWKKVLFITSCSAITFGSSYFFSQRDIHHNKPKLISLGVNKRFDLTDETIRSKIGTAVVTGGTDGIGKGSVLALAEEGWPKIVLLCRNMSKGRKVMSEIKKISHNKCKVDLYNVDLEDLNSIDRFVEEFKEPVSLLICSAGIKDCTRIRKANVQGIESHLGTNYFANFKLTTLLLPRMLQTAEQSDFQSRIILLSDTISAYKMGPDNSFRFGSKKCDPNFIREDSYDYKLAYCRAELAKVQFARFAAKHLSFVPSNQLKILLIDPGTTRSKMYEADASIFRLWVRFVSMDKYRCSSTEDAGRLVMLGALDTLKDFDTINGIYVFQKHIEPLFDSSYAVSAEFQDNQLFRMSQKWTGAWWDEFYREAAQYH